MFIYFVIFFTIILLSYFYDQSNNNSSFFIYCIFFILALFIGFRNNVGVDFYNYKMIFYNYRNLSWIEPSYRFIVLLAHELNFNFYFVNVLTTLITIYFILKAILDNNISVAFAIAIFLFSHFGYGFIINGVRQGIAASIFLFSLNYIVKRNFKKYIIYIFLATSFHYSSILLLPLYFITKINFKFINILMILLASFFIKKFSLLNNIFIQILENTKYFKYINSFFINQVSVSSGYFYYLNLIFILVLLLIISYNNYTDILGNLYKNILLILFLCKFLFFEIAIIYRFVIYFEFTLILILPYYFKNNIFKQKIFLYFFYILILLLQFFISLNKPYYKLEYQSILF